MSGDLRIGIAGLGTVGGGVAKLIRDQADLLAARCGRAIRVTAVAARDKAKDRGIDLSACRWHDDARALAGDPDVDVVVELIGGSDGVARELIEARPFIEIPAAGWAALRRSDEDMARLLQLCDSMERQEDALKWVRLDSDFHCLIAEAARNRLFARIVTDSRDALMRQSELVNLMADRRITSNLEHRRIAEAIAAGSETEARTAMRDHLDEVEQAMTWIISQRPANS